MTEEQERTLTALRYCARADGNGCEGCPLDNDIQACNRLLWSAAALIEELTEKIGNLDRLRALA